MMCVMYNIYVTHVIIVLLHFLCNYKSVITYTGSVNSFAVCIEPAVSGDG